MSDASFYPEIEPYSSGRLQVSPLHEIYYEEVGNKEGVPVIFLHGGPGGGISPKYRRFFDPEHYRIVLFDQRGAGQSTPSAELEENTTWDLVHDIELIRKNLGIRKWILFGGSWGSTLALTYAISHPEKILGLALRGIFLCRPSELHWFYQEGASHIYPDAWEGFLEPIPENERDNLMAAYHKRLTGEDEAERLRCAVAWSTWEASVSELHPSTGNVQEFQDPKLALAFARIENHYFTNNVFFESKNWILENVDKIQDIPGLIVHGRYDVVCPIKSAWDLHKLWPKSELVIAQNSGHSLMEEEISKILLEGMEEFKSIAYEY